jgi:hypothetical protein
MFVIYIRHNIMMLDATLVEVFIAAIDCKNTLPLNNRSNIDQLCMHDQQSK